MQAMHLGSQLIMWGVSTLCGIELLHNYFTNGTFDMQE